MAGQKRGENLSTKRTTSVVPPPRTRSAVTNGHRLFVKGNGSTAWARRYRDLCASRASDLGGADALSEAQLSLIKRAATMEVELEAMEGQLSKGKEISLDLYTRTVGHLRRVSETLGIERVARDVTPGSVSEYLAGKAL